MVFKVLLVGQLDAEAEGRLIAAAEVIRPPATDELTLREYVTDCDALVARTHTPVTRTVLAAGRRLRVVGVAGVGVDNIDTSAAEELGVMVLSTPAAASDAVAEFAVGLMLQLLRPVPRLMDEYRQGQYRQTRQSPHGPELRDLTIGIVGMGRIGSRVGRICSAGCGARVLYNDIVEVGPFAYSAVAVDKTTIWSQSDIVTLHVPLTEHTRGLVNADVLSRFRSSARLINTARGAVVDTAALTAALQSRQVTGAALDVTEPEPLPPKHPLFACENCILTPHVAARTIGGLRRMNDVVDDVLAYLEREKEAF